MPAPSCPSRETLLQYSIGMLSNEQSDDLAGHLESCPDCQATITTLEDAEDTLIGRLRTPPGSESCLAEPQFQTALAEVIEGKGVRSHLPERPEGCFAQMAPDPFSPFSLGEYQVQEELGRGGMGRVYKALHTKLDRVVAIKVLPWGKGTGPFPRGPVPLEDRHAITRFEREMKAVGRLAHPNIVQAHDAREIDGTPVLIMEFVDGLDLAEIAHRIGPGDCPNFRGHRPGTDAKRGSALVGENGTVPFTPAKKLDGKVGENGTGYPLGAFGLGVANACELVRRTALALQCAHEHGLVHRDIKPSNIMLTKSGEVKLLDLGLARFYAEAPSGGTGSERSSVLRGTGSERSSVPVPFISELTNSGQAMGTADYMAPEQASDSRTVDIRADIYSLGCTLYKLISGRAPFGGPEYRGTLDKLNAHVHQTPPPINQLVTDVPEKLSAILDRMLAKDPADRFPTPAEVAKILEPFCTGANLADLITRALSASPLSLREIQNNSPLSLRERARVRAEQGLADQPAGAVEPKPTAASARRRSIPIFIALALACMAAGFVMGIIIRINKSTLEVPDGSTTKISENGQIDVSLPGHGKFTGGVVTTDEKNIQGTWEVVDTTFSMIKKLPNERDITSDQVKKTTRVVITDNILKIAGEHVTDLALEYRLNPKAKTPIIDLKTYGTQWGIVSFGIYKCEGNKLTICASGLRALGIEDKQPDAAVLRPTEFWAELGSDKEFLVLRRVGEPAITEDEVEIQGTWRVESATENRLFGFAENQEVHFSRCGLTYLVKQDHGPGMDEISFGYALDPTAKPKRIDIANITTPTIYPQHGIYELTGDQLRMNWGSTNFDSGNYSDSVPSKLAPDSDSMFVVLKRVTDSTEKSPPQENAVLKPAEIHDSEETAKLKPIPANATTGAAWWAQAMFDHTSHDFGMVARGAKLEHSFVIENCYEENVHIKSVSSSFADCFTPQVDKQLLKVFEKAKILVTVDTDHFIGQRSATIIVDIDKPFPAQVHLKVTANIRDKTDIVTDEKVIQPEKTFSFRTAKVTRGDITETIAATGTLEPAEVVDVSAQVSGRIVIFGDDPRGETDPSYKGKKIDYNSPVEEGTVLARIDDALYKSRVDQEKAAVRRAEAELKLAQTKYEQTQEKAVPKAAMYAAETAVVQSKAALELAQINLDRTVIKSPVNGVIIARRLNVGQNTGTDPNTPSLFLIAKDLKKMQVWAAVNEADIGRIRDGMTASFTVDAFPNEKFTGKVVQIRKDAQMTQNVVTYTVVLSFDNSDQKLMPYMTANLQFEIDSRHDVLRVPNAALRWKPSPELMAKGGPVQIEKLEGLDVAIVRGDKDAVQNTIGALRNLNTALANQKRGIIWVKSQDGKHVRPIEVQTGLTDGTMTEISGPDVKEGMEVVIGQSQPTDAGSGEAANPFEPRIFRGRQQTVTPNMRSPEQAISDSNAPQRLQVQIDGPKQCVAGDLPSFKIHVKNGKTIPVKNIKVICSLSDSSVVPRYATDKYRTEKNNLVWTIEVLPAGEEDHFEVRCSCEKTASQAFIRATVTSEDGDKVEDVDSLEILASGKSTTPYDPVTIPNLSPVNPGQR